jgi:phosphatidylglycerol:prolipoprotein diacylglycerol transferase
MYPTLFSIGRLEIHTWGLLLAIAFIVGITLSTKRAKTRDIDPNAISNIAVVIMIAGVLGGRILYVLYHLEDFSDNPLETIAIWKGGLMMYGGVFTAFAATLVYLKMNRLPAGKVGDIFAPALALGLAFGRVGCYFNGCCFGNPTHLPWGIKFPATAEASYLFPDQFLHPTQFYSSLAGFVIFFVLLFTESRSKKRYSDGFLFFLLLTFYSIWRFSVDFLRGYEESAFVLKSASGGLFTINQLFSSIIFLISMVMIFRLRKGKRLDG